MCKCKEYRLDPEYRRCCWYAIFGAIIAVAVFSWAVQFAPRQNLADKVTVFLMLTAVATAAFLTSQWRLLLDEHGITRKRCFLRDRWSWDDFASGLIQKRGGCTLVDSTRPWWRRKLNLGFLAGDEIEILLAAINEHYKIPPPPTLPERLTIKWGFRQKATLHANGVELLVRGTPKAYLWNEVGRIDIMRLDPLRRDFADLFIELPGQEIELFLRVTNHGPQPNWRGATAEEINEFLLKYVSPDRIDIRVAGEPLRNRDLIQKKLREAEKMKRAVAYSMAISLPLLIALFVWMAVEGEPIKAAVMGAMTLLTFVPVYVSFYRTWNEQANKLKEALNSVVDGER
jgi:hypothetical protein